MLRKIVEIDEEKCDGCGLCAEACAESAIRIIDGKAKLISESYCDGLGACLGDCPNDAITVIEREADGFDEEAVSRHLAAPQEEVSPPPDRGNHACPGSMVLQLQENGLPQGREESAIPIASRLRNWPVQLRLVPVDAPYFQGADLLLAADCAPFALADFHHRLLDGKVLIIGCPKLDDAAYYTEKLAQILIANDIKSLSVVHMEVPCCFGLVELAKRAVEKSGKSVDLRTIKVGIRGDLLEEKEKVRD